MMVALAIAQCCIVLLLKGVPLWLENLLTVVYIGSMLFASVMWVAVKEKIEVLESKIEKKGGGAE